MAKIVDPDALRRNTEIVFDLENKRIRLVPTGNLDDSSPASQSGVTLQAVYSKCKELWKSEPDLNRFKFPFEAITPVKMDLVNGWDWYDDTTRRLIRDGGWSVIDPNTGEVREMYMSIASLGGRFASINDKAYYQQEPGLNASYNYFQYSDEINEPVRIYWKVGGTIHDKRNFFKIYLREWGKSYAQGNLIKDQNIPQLDYTAYKVPLTNTIDIKISATENDVATQSPYTGMSITYLKGQKFVTWSSGRNWSQYDVVLDPNNNRWYRAKSNITNSTTPPSQDSTAWEPYPGERQIGANYYAFNRIVNGNNGTLEQIYEFLQYRLRSDSNINDDVIGDNYGQVKGKLASSFASFLGDVLQTAPGVFIDNIKVDDRARIEFFDITVDGGGLDEEGNPLTTTKRVYPFVSSGTLIFNDYLVEDPDSYFRMYFKSVPDGDFDTEDAIVVNDADGNPIEGPITSSSIPFTFDYDRNSQGGRTPGTDAQVVVVAIGLSRACWVASEFTITRSVGLRFPVNAAQERNYANTD